MTLGFLEGLKVLELGDSVAAAFCGKLLADMGADVVTVEPPGGSRIRRLPPYFEGVPGHERSVLHNWLGTNKRAITLNLDDGRGRSLVRDLLREREVVITTRGKPGSDECMQVNPKLTVTTISPFGSTGPYAGYRANDLTLFALSGYAYYLATPVRDPVATPPKPNPGHQVSLVAGLRAASATLWAHAASKRKGRGVAVDVSELESLVYLMYQYTAHVANGTLPPDRAQVPGAVITIVGGLVWCLPCSDGWIMVSPREDHQFRQWCEVIGHPDWHTRPEYATPTRREENAWDIYEHSAAWTRGHTKQEASAAAQARRVACFPVNQMGDLAKLDQLKHREFFKPIDHPVIKDIAYPSLPLHVDQRSAPQPRRAPMLSEHSEEVYRALGMTAEELNALWQRGVI